jgi:hypothetical protein
VGRLGFDASAELMLLGWQNHHSAVIAFSVVGLASSRSIERLHVCFVFHTTTAGDCEDGKPRQEDGQVVQPDAPSGCQKLSRRTYCRNDMAGMLPTLEHLR